ncbi:MAG: VCBS repeat-containing protein [Ginsengibacter sp.]
MSLGLRQQLYAIFFTVVISGLLSCGSPYNRNHSYASVSYYNIEAGAKLSQQFCSQCHQFPDPSLLDAKSWAKGVLPQMGPRLGIEKNGFETYPSYKNDPYLKESIYPAKPLLTPVEWQYIIDYYTATSPDSLQQPANTTVNLSDKIFKVVVPKDLYQNAATSYIKILDSNNSSRLLVSDAMKNSSYFFDADLNVTDSFKTNGPIVDVKLEPNKLLLCNIGVLNPNNGTSGKIETLSLNTKGSKNKLLFQDLQRPVEVTAADLNNDGRQDYLVSEFGFITGKLCWMENKVDSFKKHILRPLPGAIKSYIRDVNNDGLPDIWVLFSQGEEGIFLFTNKGQGKFESSQVLRFPPSYGSSYFELADFDHDGYDDILYTCGDNADYSAILKPYHGVYIFLNDKTNHFKETFFYPINGCYKAMAKDFDGDGDLDLSCISFFPDLAHKPDEGFVYLENIGKENFKPYAISGLPQGRWLTMDTGDFDTDGKVDIALGSFNRGPGTQNNLSTGNKTHSFILLKNISSHN